jgi:hypothetical protein
MHSAGYHAPYAAEATRWSARLSNRPMSVSSDLMTFRVR